MNNPQNNINYDLVTLLQNKMKTLHRLQNFYCNDAEEAKCHSFDALETIKGDEAKHIKMLSAEIKMRMEAGLFI